MKISKLVKAKGVIVQLAQEKVSVKFSYKMMKFIRTIEAEEIFYSEKMREIINLYCEKDEEGNFVPAGDGIKIKEEHIAECKQKIADLDSLEVDTPEIKFTLDELSEIKLSIQDMMILSDFIEE